MQEGKKVQKLKGLNQMYAMSDRNYFVKDTLNVWAMRGMYDLDYSKISPSAFFLVSCLLKDCVAELTAKKAAGHWDQQKPAVQ